LPELRNTIYQQNEQNFIQIRLDLTFLLYDV